MDKQQFIDLVTQAMGKYEAQGQRSFGSTENTPGRCWNTSPNAAVG